tara:strand:+ start:275388 stop:275846 length:459 start_codon:yes stop_codon:yes gene_type:complete
MISLRFRGRLGLLSLAFVAATLAGCQSGPYEAMLLVQGGENLNKTADSKPSSVSIRILQLKKKDDFESATDEELFAKDLKKQPWVVSYKEAKVRVGIERELDVVIQPEVKFLGVVAMFNEVDGQWRSVIDVDTLAANKLVFDEYEFSAEPRK